MDANTAAVLTDAIKIFGPALIAAGLTYLGIRSQFKLEGLRLHEKERIEAYKKLLLFATRLRNQTFPLASDKERAFITTMKREYFGKIDTEIVYFSTEVSDILSRLEEEFLCVTDPDLAPEMDPKEHVNFLEQELFNLLESLVGHARKTMRERGIAA